MIRRQQTDPNPAFLLLFQLAILKPQDHGLNGRHVDEGYKNLPFPFQEISISPLMLEVEWNFYQLIVYMSTWSAVKAATQALGHNPLNVLADALLPEWEDPELPRVIRWPLSVRAGRIIL